MNLQEYNEILVILVCSPLGLFFLLVLCLWKWRAHRNEFVLLVLKGIVMKRNIDGNSRYLFCGRVIKNDNKNGFRELNIMKSLLIVSAYVVTVTLQTVLVVGTFQLSYDCVEESNVDCFKRRLGEKIELFPNESPLHCPSVPMTQLVFCYRTVAVEVENWFATFTAAYILVRMMRFIMFILTWLLLRKNKPCPIFPLVSTISFISFLIYFVTLGAIVVVIFFSAFYTDFAYATRHLSLSEIMQIIFILLLFPLFTLAVKWNALADDCEYYVDVTKLAKAEFEVFAEHAENRVCPQDDGDNGITITDLENHENVFENFGAKT